MRLGSHAQLGAVLFAVACNSVLGIEPGAYVGQAGAAGSSGVAPLAGGARDAGSGTGGERDAGPGMGGVHDARSGTGGERDAGTGGAHGAGSGTGGAHDAGSGTGGASFVTSGAGNRYSGGASAAGLEDLGGALFVAGGSAYSTGNAGAGRTDGGAPPTGGVSGNAGVLQAGAGQGGEAGAICQPHQTECLDRTTLRTCQDNGEWGSPEVCEGQACTGEPPACRGSCAPGSTYCEDGDLMTCDATGTPRAESCAADDRACIEQPQGSGVFACGGECAPGSRRCLDNTVQVCSDQGGYDDLLSCTDQAQTCRESTQDASCDGECAPGRKTCRDGAPYRCNEGTLVLDGTCTVTQVCRDGVCVQADHLVGNSTALEGNVVTYADSLLLCRLPPLEHQAELKYFRAIGGTLGGLPAFARMVLYADDGSGNGPNGQPVAQTAGSSFSLPADKEVAIDTSDVAPRLQRGVTYWVGIATLVSGQASEDSSVRGLSGSPASGVCRRIPFTFSDVFPTWSRDAQSPEPGIRVDNLDVNLFLEVRDLE